MKRPSWLLTADLLQDKPKLFEAFIECSTWVLALAMHHVSNSSAAVKVVLPFKDGIVSVTCLGFNSPLAVSPPSTITTSPGWRYLKLPHSLKICTSLISPSNKSETKHAPLFGVTAIRHFKILQCV